MEMKPVGKLDKIILAAVVVIAGLFTLVATIVSISQLGEGDKSPIVTIICCNSMFFGLLIIAYSMSKYGSVESKESESN
tara:strand:+ start:188 stop:424 length:237 start_codon:yes stop_codon:yes gene_type:complete